MVPSHHNNNGLFAHTEYKAGGKLIVDREAKALCETLGGACHLSSVAGNSFEAKGPDSWYLECREEVAVAD